LAQYPLSAYPSPQLQWGALETDANYSCVTGARRIEINVVPADDLNWHLRQILEIRRRIELRRGDRRDLGVLRRHVGRRRVGREGKGGRLVGKDCGQFERDLIRERTRAGLDVAMARGRRGGRKPVVTVP